MIDIIDIVNIITIIIIIIIIISFITVINYCYLLLWLYICIYIYIYIYVAARGLSICGSRKKQRLRFTPNSHHKICYRISNIFAFRIWYAQFEILRFEIVKTNRAPSSQSKIQVFSDPTLGKSQRRRQTTYQTQFLGNPTLRKNLVRESLVMGTGGTHCPLGQFCFLSQKQVTLVYDFNCIYFC